MDGARWIPTPSGLSPRMRGNPVVKTDHVGVTGSIPAHAGEPPQAGWPGFFLKVYPRACGGTVTDLDGDNGDKGLSPRMRGNRTIGYPEAHGCGSIPAHAGEPIQSMSRSPTRRVYPRACGGTKLTAAAF